MMRLMISAKRSTVMKKLFNLFIAGAVAVLSVASCNDKISSDSEPVYTYRFTLSDPVSKAVLDTDGSTTYTKWESGDQLGVYTKNNDSEISYNRYGNIDVTKSPVEFTIYSVNALTAGSEVYTYFPYDSSNSTGDATDPSKVTLSIPVSQTGKMNDMPMVGVPYTVTEDIEAEKSTPVADINLYNLGGIFQFNIFSSNESYRSETVKSVSFTADQEIAGSFVFDITQVKGLTITGNAEKVITLAVSGNPGADKTSSLQANMVVKPGTYTGTVVVTTDAATYTYTLTSGKTVERSHIKPLNVDLTNGERATEAVEKYVSIKSETQLRNGAKLLIVATNGATYYQLPVNPTVSSGKIAGVEVSVTDNSISASPSSAWTINSSGSYWTITDGSNQIYHKKGGSTGTDLEYGANSNKYLWSISRNGDANYKMAAVNDNVEQDRGMLYNTTNSCFGGYALSNINATGYTGILLFVRESDIPVVAVTGVSLDKSELSLSEGRKYTLTATITPSDATNQNVTWSSDNTTVATVSDSGVVTAVAEGTANITVTTEDGGFAATCTVTVEADKTATVSFSPSNFTGGTQGSGTTTTATVGAVTISTDKGYIASTEHVRVYSGGIITISSEKTITQIKLTSTAKDKSNYGPTKIALQDENGTSSYSDNVTTWTGSSTKIQFKATAQYRFTGIEVVYEK